MVSTLATTGTVYTDPVAGGPTSILPTNVTSGDIQLQIGGTNGTTEDIPRHCGWSTTL